MICQTEPYIREDFSALNALLAHIVDFHPPTQQPSPVLDLIQRQTSSEEQEFLSQVSMSSRLSATVLPIHSVGVQVCVWVVGPLLLRCSSLPTQGDCRTYNYVAALSSDQEPCWPELMKLAKIIPRICHAINRLLLSPVRVLNLHFLSPFHVVCLHSILTHCLSQSHQQGCVGVWWWCDRSHH